MNPDFLASRRSRDEIVEGIRALSPADWARLRKVAQYYSRPQMSAEDLLQEAFARALDGRNCPIYVSVVKFLAEAMRSIADGETDKIEHRLPVISMVARTGNMREEALEFPDSASTPEQQLMDEESVAQAHNDIIAIFEDDLVAQTIVEGMMEGMTTEELRELSGLGQTAYESKRKLIRRRIDKKYPDGWKP